MLPAAQPPFLPPDWYRDQDHDPSKGKRAPQVPHWHNEEPLRVRPSRELIERLGTLVGREGIELYYAPRDA